MRALIVNNTSDRVALLQRVFSAYEVTVISFDQLQEVILNDFDFAVLSGSSSFPVVGNEDVLEPELNFIRTATIPILGICYGFELVVVAFRGSLKMLPAKEQGVLHMDIMGHDPLFKNVEDLFVYEGHRWTADVIPDVFISLASSPHGIEAVKHRDLLLYGVQFHPEKLEHETAGQKIIENFIQIVDSSSKSSLQ